MNDQRLKDKEVELKCIVGTSELPTEWNSKQMLIFDEGDHFLIDQDHNLPNDIRIVAMSATLPT